MLDILHEQINKIVPIDGISDNQDGSYRVDYSYPPDQNQIDQVNEIIQSWPLNQSKLQKINDLDKEWQKVLEGGWETPYGWKLGLSNNDMVLLNSTFLLAKESIAINIPIFIVDTENEPHEINLQDLTILMLQYGQARASLSASYAAKLKSIKEATSIDQLNNLNVIIN